jgi:hypothetical protein
VTRAELAILRTATEAALPAYLEDLRRLVDVDSGTYTKAGVDAVGAWVAGRLESLGASVVRHANADLGDTIVGTFERDATGPTVLVIGHLDTVFDAGTVAQRPFAIRGRRAYGPGVSDMKAGLLTGLQALAALRDVDRVRTTASSPSTAADWLPVGRLVFIANRTRGSARPSAARSSSSTPRARMSRSSSSRRVRTATSSRPARAAWTSASTSRDAPPTRVSSPRTDAAPSWRPRTRPSPCRAWTVARRG